MNKLAYDLALLCVEHGLRINEPESYQDSAQFALKTFKKAYKQILESGEPFIDTFGSGD